jgi:hypothetical protein
MTSLFLGRLWLFVTLSYELAWIDAYGFLLLYRLSSKKMGQQ